jgi:hypothetical protein
VRELAPQLDCRPKRQCVESGEFHDLFLTGPGVQSLLTELGLAGDRDPQRSSFCGRIPELWAFARTEDVRATHSGRRPRTPSGPMPFI